MTNRQRYTDCQAYVLHRRPFRDTSQIVDCFTRDHGRIAVVARGIRSAKSRLRGVLQPFTPLSIGFSARTDLGTLTGAEAASAQIWLAGDLLHAGFYLNELILKLLTRTDPQPDIFDLYTETLSNLARCQGRPDRVLRQFELNLLEHLGYGIQLDADVATGARLEDDRWYRIRPDAGPLAVAENSGPLVYRGDCLQAVAARDFDKPGALRAARGIAFAALDLHLDGQILKTRAVMREIADHRNKKEISKQ